jgi:hypothetical protein
MLQPCCSTPRNVISHSRGGQAPEDLRRCCGLLRNNLDHRLINARAEDTNIPLRALTIRARGLHSTAAFIAIANLAPGGPYPLFRRLTR